MPPSAQLRRKTLRRDARYVVVGIVCVYDKKNSHLIYFFVYKSIIINDSKNVNLSVKFVLFVINLEPNIGKSCIFAAQIVLNSA